MSGRCKSCDKIMSDSEMCRKNLVTGEYFDLCSRCLREVSSIVDIPVWSSFNEEDKYETTEIDETTGEIFYE